MEYRLSRILYMATCISSTESAQHYELLESSPRRILTNQILSEVVPRPVTKYGSQHRQQHLMRVFQAGPRFQILASDRRVLTFVSDIAHSGCHILSGMVEEHEQAGTDDIRVDLDQGPASPKSSHRGPCQKMHILTWYRSLGPRLASSSPSSWHQCQKRVVFDVEAMPYDRIG